jgi:hypothetical protein
MYLRFICDWPPHYKDGQAIEIPDRIGADFVARCLAEIVTAEDVQSYARTMGTIDRLVAKHVDEKMSAKPARAGRRVISEDQWRRELGQTGPSPYRHLPAVLTVRGS